MRKALQLIFFTALTTTSGISQNTAVFWGGFDQGFGAPRSATTMVRSVIGQQFARAGESVNFLLEAGFLADTLLRGSPPLVLVYSFQRKFGVSGGVSQGFSVIQTRDSGYVLGGWTASYGGGRMYVVKTDLRGAPVWTRAYETPSYDQCLSLEECPDGGLLLVGYRAIPFTSITDLFIVRTDAAGDTLWTRRIGNGSSTQGNSVRSTVDGSFVIAGTKPRPVYLDNDFYMVKISAGGDSLWTKTFHSGNDVCTSIDRTSDGGYLLTGWSQIPYSTYIVLIKTDSVGNAIWIKGVDAATNYVSRGYGVRESFGGGYAIAGSDGPDLNSTSAYLCRTDTSGIVLWQKRFRGGGFAWTARDVRQTRDGGYILTGTVYDQAVQRSDAFLLKTSINGDSLWCMTYGGAGDDAGISVRQTFDGGFIAGGYTSSGSTGLSDMYLIKGDDLGTVTSISAPPAVQSPEQLRLYQNYPNPFNPSTTISYDLPAAVHVELKLYSILGQEVRTLVDEVQTAGSHAVRLDATTLASGVYLCRIVAGSLMSTRKLLLVR